MQLTSVRVVVAVVAGAVLLTGAARAQDRTDWPEGLPNHIHTPKGFHKGEATRLILCNAFSVSMESGW